MSSALEVGYVYHVKYFSQVLPQKGKFGICISVSKSYFFTINTENRMHYDCIPILVSEHPALKQDRYVSCSKILTLVPEAQVEKKYKISENFKKELIDKISSSKLLSKKQKDEILSELKV